LRSEVSKTFSNPIILIEKCCQTGNRIAAVAQVLDEAVRSLIQNLQMLNQKVK
jgi:hypothetical protein